MRRGVAVRQVGAAMRWVGLVTVLAACDPAMAIRGTVRALPDHCQAGVEVYAEGRPLDGASIVVQCPGDDTPRIEATSNAVGEFESGRIGVMAMDCTVRVDAAGHTPAYYRVGEICAVIGSGGCLAFSLHAELAQGASVMTPLEL